MKDTYTKPETEIIEIKTTQVVTASDIDFNIPGENL